MKYLIEHYKEVIAITGTLTGFLGLIITVYSKYRDSKIKMAELELKKEQIAIDKKHQITKETYQKLFEQKIKIYEELYTTVNKFKKQLYDVGTYFLKEQYQREPSMEQLTVEDVNISALRNIFTIIQKNHFLVSNDLMENYEKLYDLYRKHTAEFNFMLDVGAYGDPNETDKEWERIRDEFYESYRSSIDGFFTQIEKEIIKMKKVLEY